MPLCYDGYRSQTLHFKYINKEKEYYIFDRKENYSAPNQESKPLEIYIFTGITASIVQKAMEALDNDNSFIITIELLDRVYKIGITYNNVSKMNVIKDGSVYSDHIREDHRTYLFIIKQLPR
jgi:hypothetical protein